MLNEKLQNILTHFKIIPNNEQLYIEALTHTSYKNDKHLDYSYERLEFLGDAIIHKIVSEYLYKKEQHLNEGDMSKIRNMIVQSHTMVLASKDIGLDKAVFVGGSVPLNVNGEISEHIIEDIYEAFIGATYLDQGEKKCYKILKQTIIHYYEINFLNNYQDWKSQFQEIIQKVTHSKPLYKCIKKTNTEAHVELSVNGKVYGIGIGTNTKKAEINAAKNAIVKLNNNKNAVLNK